MNTIGVDSNNIDKNADDIEYSSSKYLQYKLVVEMLYKNNKLINN